MTTAVSHVRRALAVLDTVQKTRRGAAVLPRMLTYVVTFACNARCVMCDSWKKPPENELTLGELERIFADLPQMDVVRLTGGEPFVRKDFAEIAGLVEKHLEPQLLHVTSNGFQTERIVRFCEERRREVPLYMLISLDGVGEAHDTIRGKSTAWARASETVRRLAPRQQELGIKLAVNQTLVDAAGVAEYTKLHDWLAPLGVEHRLVLAYDASATYSLLRELDVAPTHAGTFPLRAQLDTESLRVLLDRVDRDLDVLPATERIAKRYYVRGLRARLLDEGPVESPPCVALGAHLRMFPDGSVPVCQFNTRRVGSLRDEHFRTMWTSAQIEKERKWVAACPGCWAECEVMPNAAYSGAIAKEAVREVGRTARDLAMGLAAR